MADKKLQVTIDLKDQFTQKMQNIEKSVSGTNTKMESLGTTIFKANVAFAAFSKVAGLAGRAIGGAINKSVEFVKTSLSLADNLQQVSIAFGVMLGSGERAQKLLKDLAHFAKTTPFELTELHDLSKTLIAVGYDAEEVIPTLRRIGDIAAGVGKDKMPFLIKALSDVKVKGRLMGPEMLQFRNAAIGIDRVISDNLNISMAEFNDLMEKGLVDYKMVERALFSLSERGGRFDNMMNKQSGTLTILQSNLQDAKDQFMMMVGGMTASGELIKGGVLDQMSQGLGKLMGGLDGSKNALDNLAQSISRALGSVIRFVTNFIEAAITGDRVKKAFESLKATVSGVIERITNASRVFGGFNVQSKEFAENIAVGIVRGVEKMVVMFEKLYNWVVDNKDELKEFALAVRDIVVAIADLVRGLAKVGKFFRDNQDAWRTLKVLATGPAAIIPDLREKFEKKATGTMYSSGGMTLVGERGPELVNLPRGSKVLTNQQTSGMGGSTTNININLSGAVVTNQEQFIRELESRISRSISNQNRLYQYGLS